MASSTVGPGKDYSTLQAWADARASNPGTEDAVCYSGSDLGGFFLAAWTPSSTTVSVAPGNQHNGTDAGHTGVAYMGDTLHAYNVANLTIRGLRIEGGMDIESDTAGTSNTCSVENCLVIATDGVINNIPMPSAILFLIIGGSFDASSLTATARNNIVLCQSNDQYKGIFGYATFAADGIPTLNLTVQNNSILALALDAGGIVIGGDSGASASSPVLNCTAKNNVSFDAPNCYELSSATSLTFDHNLSSDTSASNYGGAGNLINKASSTVVVNSITNPTLKTTSPAKDTGVTIGSFSTDAIGVARPQGAAWDMGALELAAAVAGRLRRAFPFRFFRH